MDDIKNIVNAVIGNIAEHNPDTHNKVERIWANLLNEKELKHTKIIGVKEEGLLVCVDSPAWLYQMRIRQTKILKQLKEEVPHIKYIRFKMGKIK
ncbi:MAG: DUF721 domain-containing protein [Candidatus Omnitrophica bacterium]|nr:DUF721 domain-containing protein [Candidatus Omnitrophota bacterium]